MTRVDKHELFATSDVVSLHLVLSDRTRNVVDAAALAAMKPTAYLVNTSRAGLVDQAALMDALVKFRLAGAGLDVYPDEPLSPTDPVRDLDNVILTPHLGYVSRENFEAFYRNALEAVRAWRGGRAGARAERLTRQGAARHCVARKAKGLHAQPLFHVRRRISCGKDDLLFGNGAGFRGLRRIAARRVGLVLRIHRVERGIAIGIGHARGLEPREVEQIAVHQVRGHHARQRVEHVPRAARMLAVPFLDHPAHFLALQVLLRAAQVARDDGELLELGVGDQVAFGHVGQRPDHRVAAVVRDQRAACPWSCRRRTGSGRRCPGCRRDGGPARSWSRPVRWPRGTGCHGAAANRTSTWSCPLPARA